jgi:two-component system, OmpR family, phosphate regulon sensor histidine kinase PhoR
MYPISESLFETIFYQSNDPIVIIKADKPTFTIVAFNEQYKATTRTPADNIIGKGAFEVYKPERKADKEQFAVLIDGLMRTIDSKQQVNLPVLYFERPAANGKSVEPTWWQIQITPIFDGDGGVEYLKCDTHNITRDELNRLALNEARNREQMLNEELKTLNEELVATNEELNTSIEELNQSKNDLYDLNLDLEQRITFRTAALVESEKHFRSILNALPQIAWTNTIDGTIDFYNQRWYDYTGLDFEQSKAGNWKEIIHPDDLQYNAEIFTSIIESKKPGELETREKGNDGMYRWHLIRMQPIFNETGDIKLWIGTATDIQHLKVLQQQKDDFIGVVSHELKTPLTSIKAYVQILNIKSKDEKNVFASETLDKVEVQVNKMTNMINGFLNLSRLDAGKIQVNLQRFSLNELIADLIEEITSVSSSHIINFLPSQTLMITADRDMIEHVISNLLSNAIKYSPYNTIIEIICEVVDQMIQFSIKDEGIGIRKNDIGKVFERYYRVQNNQTSGFGIGLYLSAEIIQRHHGSIWVKSKYGKGSAFYFNLPISVK